MYANAYLIIIITVTLHQIKCIYLAYYEYACFIMYRRWPLFGIRKYILSSKKRNDSSAK